MNASMITPQELHFLRSVFMEVQDTQHKDDLPYDEIDEALRLVEALLERTEDVEIPEDITVGC